MSWHTLALVFFALLVGCALSQPPVPNLDNDDGYLVLYFISFADPHVRPLGVTVQMRITSMGAQAWFDTWSVYSATAVGTVVPTNQWRRPAAERTPRNINIAMAYATYHVARDAAPWGAKSFDAFMDSLGLDKTLNSTDLTRPEGIGIAVAKAILAFRHADGMNQLGDWSRDYNRVPYEDYTGYASPNEPEPAKPQNPMHWQPMLYCVNGKCNSQAHYTPQSRFMRPYTHNNIWDPKLQTSSPDFTEAGIRAEAMEVINAVGALTDREKMIAEHFNDKLGSVGFTLVYLSQKYNLSLTNGDFVSLELGREMATVDAVQVGWHNKRRFDYARPQNVIRYYMADETIQSYGGPGMGTVSMKGRDYFPWIPSDWHSEFPSVTTCINTAVSQFHRTFFKTDDFGYSKTFLKGSSQWEPGVPATDITLTWPTYTQYAHDAGQARLYAGVHFQGAINASRVTCGIVGDLAIAKLQSLLNGTATPLMPVNKADVMADLQAHPDPVYLKSGAAGGLVVVPLSVVVMLLVIALFM